MSSLRVSAAAEANPGLAASYPVQSTLMQILLARQNKSLMEVYFSRGGRQGAGRSQSRETEQEEREQREGTQLEVGVGSVGSGIGRCSCRWTPGINAQGIGGAHG